MVNRILVILLLICSSQNLSSQPKISGFKPEIAPYIDFIKVQQQSPIAYLLQKYKSHDVIVFGERDHRDITQYYFIEKLINSEEFYKQVGVIYTEVGSSNFNDTLNKILQNPSLSLAEAQKKLLAIYREISYQAFWDKYNCFYLWKTVYTFNQSHPNYPISIQMTSHPFSWNEITDTAICRTKTNEVEKNYDKAMADYFCKSFEEIQNSPRNKAFVIMNYPHSLRKWTSKKNKTHTDMFGAYINERYSNRVCYIIVNPYTLNFQPVADGKWDAAFQFCKDKTIGFDFKNSPFGKDTFDVWPLEKGILSFEELYDGMIYINPITKCENVIGVPGFIDRKFGKEYIRRLKLRMYVIRGEEYKTKLKWEKEYCNSIRTLSIYDDIRYKYGNDKSRSFDGIVDRWLLFEK